MTDIPARQVRARYDDTTIVVHQAYRPEIADAALAAGTFVPPFGTGRMTWIKPSFLWMMYRCGWAEKPGQERVLAVRITRAGFEEALAGACLSHFDSDLSPLAREIHGLVRAGDLDATALLPSERPYPLGDAARAATGAS